MKNVIRIKFERDYYFAITVNINKYIRELNTKKQHEKLNKELMDVLVKNKFDIYDVEVIATFENLKLATWYKRLMIYNYVNCANPEIRFQPVLNYRWFEKNSVVRRDFKSYCEIMRYRMQDFEMIRDTESRNRIRRYFFRLKGELVTKKVGRAVHERKK